MAQVKLQNVSKVFTGNIVAVSDFSLQVADGQLLVVVGPSACGKTTLLRLVAGLERPDTGDVYIAGRRVTDAPPKDRDVAMVFQNYALYPHMTVEQNLGFALKCRGVNKREIRRRVEEVAAMLGIEGLLNRKPAFLSGGQRQRVALGKALVRPANAHLFDEPLSNVDAAQRRQMRLELKRLHQRLKYTMLYVTHDQAEAMALGQRICVMRAGRIQQVGTPDEVYARPVNRFVAGFLGTPGMNFFEGRLRHSQGRWWFVLSEDRIALPGRLAEAVAGRNDQQFVLGVRPEDVRPAESTGRKTVVRAAVESVESCGAAATVRFAYGRQAGFAMTTTRIAGLVAGRVIPVYFDPQKLHIFEAGPSGRNLGLGGNP